MYINTLPFKAVIDAGQETGVWLQGLQARQVSSREYQYTPLQDVLRWTGIKGDLFDSLLTFENYPVNELIASRSWSLQVENVQFSAQSNFPLTIIIGSSKEIGISFSYNTDLLDQAYVAAIRDQFEKVLLQITDGLADRLSDIRLLTPSQEHKLLVELNDIHVDYPKDKSVVDLFEDHALRSPDSIAIVYEGQQLSYRELSERSSQLAHYLRGKGVKEETLVPLLSERGSDMLIGILGILKAGAAYVPIDTDFPLDRISYILEDTGATVVVGSNESSQKLPVNLSLEIIELDEDSNALRQQSSVRPVTSLQPDNLAYVIYTSGSTGRPKGVQVTHRNLVDYIYGLDDRIGISACRSFALVSSIATDLGNTVLYGSLMTGGALHVFSKNMVSHIEELHEYFNNNQIDCLKIVPSHWRALMMDGQPLLPLKLLIFGGEALSPAVIEMIGMSGTSCRVINHYGPTETTIGKLLYEVEAGKQYEQTIPIGKPFSNTRIYVLSKEMSLCPIGVPGQLYIAGDGISRGYLNNDELTLEKFIRDPFVKDGHARMYGTGDRVQYDAEDNIIFIGRVDDQVKIRGYRVEPGEVGRIMEESSLVSQAVVLPREDKQGNMQLVGYVVPAGEYDRTGVQSWLKEQLPEYMIPAHIIALESLPLTANGKIDRRALPDPEGVQPEGGYIAPRNETESKLAAIWQEVLEVDEVGITDDFFELGGHSLLAVRLVSAVRKGFGTELPISEVFDYPTVGLLARRLAEEPSGQLMPPVLPVVLRPEHIPLSFSQERLWFIDKLEGSVQYHVPAVLRLKGSLDPEILEKTLQAIINRHEVLRTVIREEEEGQGYQHIMETDGWSLGITKKFSGKGETAELSLNIGELVTRPFDLSTDYMLRADLIELAVEDYILVVTMHHIASDGWSKSILVKEVIALYESYLQGQEVQLTVLALQYADYAIWQRQYIQGAVLDDKLSYWKEKLEGVATLQLPIDYSRPAIQRSRGAICSFKIDQELSSALAGLSHQQGATLYMTLLASFNVLLYRYGGQEDICIGSPVAGRNQQELESLIGFFINTLALRSRVTGDMSFTELLQEVKIMTLEAYAHQEVPFEKVVDAVVKERDMSRSPLFQVLFSLQNTPDVPELKLGNLRLITEGREHVTSKFDMTVVLSETSTGIRGTIEYATDLYKGETIERMISHYINLLGSIVTSPENQLSYLGMLSIAEEERLLIDFNDTQVAYPNDKSIAALFQEQVIKTPEAIAIIFEEQQVTYQALNVRSNQLGRYLQERGVNAGTMVPVLLERGIDIVVAILAILKAGGAYVPINPDYPADRISFMLDDTGGRVVVTSGKLKGTLSKTSGINMILLDDDWEQISRLPNTNIVSDVSGNDLAYVIYTSGSTGQPKGVMVEQRSVVRLVKSTNYVQISESDTILSLSNFSFDGSVFDIFGALLNGASVVILSTEALVDLRRLSQTIEKNNVSIFFITTALFNSLIDTEFFNFEKLRYILFGGELVSLNHVKRFKAYKIATKLVHVYGPTENTTFSSYYVVDEIDEVLGTIPIGRPISNTDIYIFDKDQRLQPVGITGEICVGGAGLARGYLNRPELTEEKFVRNPYSQEAGSRLYRTGDLGRWLPDGSIEFLGRIDDQVKIHGFRIELGEIESALNECRLVHQAVVLSRQDVNRTNRLIGYVVPEGEYNKQAIISYLQTRLPEYMIPGLWVEMDSFPLTRNGKIDKKALPDADITDLVSNVYVAPRNETEQALARIWQQLLGLERVGIYDNFFEIGGHSLLAMRVVSSVRRELNIELNIRNLFVFPIVADLGAHLDEQNKGDILPSIVTGARPEHIPLSFSQERLWFIDRLEGSGQYHMPSVLRLKGSLNREALRRTLVGIINRHEVLRTVILEHEGQGYQHIMTTDGWSLGIVENLVDEAGLPSYIANLTSKPFNLSKDYMLRADLIRLGEENHILVVTMHHIASDGWSRSILVKEVIAMYQGYAGNVETVLPELTVQYADYAIWQRKLMNGEALENKLGYWKAKLDGVATLQLPTDYSRPLVQQSRGATRNFRIDKGLLSQLQALSHQQGTTLYMTLLSVFKVLLYRYSGQEDICVGTGIAGRQQQELEGLIGFFVNTLALRTQVRGDAPFTTLLRAVRTTTLDAYEHQEVPFEKVVDSVVKERDLSRNPLIQVMFVLQNTPEVPDLSLGEVNISLYNTGHITSRFDITFSVTEVTDGLEASVEYNTDLYELGTIDRMISHYKELLYSVVLNPETETGQLAMLSPAEEKTLLQEFNATYMQYPRDKSIVDLFQEQVIRNPEAIALVFERDELNYEDLNERSNRLARYLQGKGVKQETLVPICVERSPEMIVGILGILKAGGAYVPIDPSYPEDRISYMLEDTGAELMLGSRSGRSKVSQNETIQIIELDGDWELIQKEKSSNLGVVIRPEQLAYVIYTSGSTGRPKGVMIEHRSVVNLVTWHNQEYEVAETSKTTSMAGVGFDAFGWEIWPYLSAGASICIIDDDTRLSAIALWALFIGKQITHSFISTALVPDFIDTSRHKVGSLKYLLTGGDKLSGLNLEGISYKLVNNYGPTENTVVATNCVVSQNDKVPPIGKPISNVQAFILSLDGQLSPIGVSGEILIGGAGLARGYLNRAELTAERFIKSPFSDEPGARLYKTGDMGRWLADGNIEYLGRVDDQVKIRGYRIELGEIENVLNQSDQVSQAIVLAKEDNLGNKRLISYYVPDWQFVKAEEHKLYQEQVAAWKELYEVEYGQTEDGTDVDEEFNIIGWNDSFTGLPIPAEQMQAWLDDIAGLILSENPGHVLEIGCGTGLIYYQLAGKVKKYLGIDMSVSSINQINSRINKGLRDYGPTELWVSPAHEVTLPEGEQVDTILLNSIIQYFPGEGYMDEVIAKSLSLLNGSGRIIVGDVRDNRSLEMFKARLQMQKLQSTANIQVLNWAVEQGVLKENELCLSPEYFYRLQSIYPEITHIDIEWKHGSYINELTLYRYNVIIYVGIDGALNNPKWENWNTINQQNILDRLSDEDKIIAIKDAPNPRLWKEKLLNNVLQQKTASSLGDLSEIIESEDEETLSIQKILSIADAHGYHYRLLLDEDPFKVNVLFEKTGKIGFIRSVYAEDGYSPGAPNANIPLFAEISSGFKRDIRFFLQQRLPDYMIPQDFIVVRQLPLTSNGKIDRKALPDPGLTVTIGEYIAPRNETEAALAGIWQELLGVERIGINDNFFELGGDSILTIQVVSRMRRLGHVIQPKDVFNYQEIASLSAAIGRGMENEVTGEQGVLSGSFGLIPIQSWYLEKERADLSHFNQSVGY